MKAKIVFGKEGKEFYLEGKRVSEAEFRSAMPCQSLSGGDFGGGVIVPKPRASEALAVHPNQVKEATERDKRVGVPTEYLQDGRPIIRSRAHQKALIKSLGYRNKDGGYGD